MPVRKTILAAVLLFAAAPATADPVPADIGARVIEGHVAPALSAFATAAGEMETRVQALCAEPGGERLAGARDGLAELVSAWGGVFPLRFGPLQAGNRFERIFFWPDPRGVIVRQVQALLAEGDRAALSAGVLAGRSVAVQGLPALEFALHGSGAEELEQAGDGFRCAYAAAVAGNIANMADELAAEWAAGAPFHAAFTVPSATSDPYRSEKEVAGEIVKALGTGLQFVRNAELLPALGETADKARGRRAPLWRSDLTFVLAAAQIEGLSALAEATGLREAGDPDTRAALDALRFDLNHALDALRAVSTPAEEAFADPEDRERIRYVSVVLDAANGTVGERLSAALGLTMGFNALDGD